MTRLTRRSLLRAGVAAPLVIPGRSLARARIGGAVPAAPPSGGGTPVTIPGSPFPDYTQTAPQLFSPAALPPISGTVVIHGQWSHGAINTGETITYQWFIDGVAASPVLQQLATDPFAQLPWTWNSTVPTISGVLVADGTHHFWCRIYDSDQRSVQDRETMGGLLIVANSGFSSLAQTIPVGGFSSIDHHSPFPDRTTYDPANPYPTRVAHPIAYTPILPAFNPSSPYNGVNAALLRDANNWYGEEWPGVRSQLYGNNPQFATTTSGGITIDYLDPRAGVSVAGSYDGVVTQNTWDGIRFNNWVSPFSNYIEDPAGDGSWLGVEISGRVFRLKPDGTVTTIVGPRRNKTIPTISGATADQIEAIRETVGTFTPSGIDFGGGNDLCVDPRNSNILYCVAQVDNWIGMINMSAQTVTVYAGSPGAADAYIEGSAGPAGVARFAAPTSILMDASGTMYVSDQNNSAIRRIPSSGVGSPGTVSTLCGGTVGPTPPTVAQLGATTDHNVTSITWTGGSSVGGGSGHVVLDGAAPTDIGLGFCLLLSGATHTGTNDPNTGGFSLELPRYLVSAMTNSRDFTIIIERTKGGSSGTDFGTLGGAMVLTSHNFDRYSQPTTTAFASTCTPFPMVLRFASPGPSPGHRIVLGESGTLSARLIDLDAGTITRITSHDAHAVNESPDGWIWLDCDWAGAGGPVDDLLISVTESPLSPRDFWRASMAQTQSPSIGVSAYGAVFTADGEPLPQYGPPQQMLHGFGHYPWAVAFSRTQARILGTGTGAQHPLPARALQPSDPTFSLDFTRWERGRAVHSAGVPNGFPADIRPAFLALWGSHGGGYINNTTGKNTFEDLNATFPSTTPGDLGDQQLAAYIQGGMGGIVPRPELTGNPLNDFIYFVRRGTYARSLPPVVQPAPTDPDTTPPVIQTLSAVRNSPTQITVTWTTNEPTTGIACTSTAHQIGYPWYSMYSTISAPGGNPGTSHSMAVPCLSNAPPFNNSPVHYTVVVKDVAGNFAYAADQTIT